VRQVSMALITFNCAWLTWPRVGITPSGTEVAEDIRNFQSGALHDGAETTSEGSSWGLATSRSTLVYGDLT
jgi:hypothetical protein